MEKQKITFDQLPQVVAELRDAIAEIKTLVSQPTEAPEKDKIFTVPEAAEFLSLSVPTVYGLISKGNLPVMKRSKRCYFSKVELTDYLKKGRKRSNDDLEKEAGAYLNNPKK